MGRHAQCAWIIRVFAIVLAAMTPVAAVAAVTADAVAFGAGAMDAATADSISR